jgi:hypothetical protein
MQKIESHQKTADLRQNGLETPANRGVFHFSHSALPSLNISWVAHCLEARCLWAIGRLPAEA